MEVLPFDPSDKAGMRLEIDKLRPEEIVEFLAINPMVASFEWYDLLNKADECARTGMTTLLRRSTPAGQRR